LPHVASCDVFLSWAFPAEVVLVGAHEKTKVLSCKLNVHVSPYGNLFLYFVFELIFVMLEEGDHDAFVYVEVEARYFGKLVEYVG
jgi:hypothetical protein